MTQTTRVIISDGPSVLFNTPAEHRSQRDGVWCHPERIRPLHSRSSASGESSSRRSGGPIPSCPTPRRTRTGAGGGVHDYGFRGIYTPSQCHNYHHQQYHHQEPHQEPQPWESMAQTYTWVLEQEIADMAKKNEETVRWVLEQQQRDVREKTLLTMLGVENRYRQLIDDMLDDFQREKEILEAREEETRRKAWRWQRDLERSVQDEVRRLQAKRREAEKYRMAYDRRRAYEDARERERRRAEREREKVAREQRERRAWREYEERWTVLATNTDAADPLTFHAIPWPTVVKPKVAEDVSPARVTMFLLSPLHSEEQTRKERIKSALRRWHPDRFGRLLSRVTEEDKGAVEKAVGTIVRCLNNLLEKEC